MKKSILLSLLLILCVFLIPVHAETIINSDNVLIEEGKYDSTRLIAGNKITNKSEVNGLLFSAGNNLTLNGSALFGFYAGNNISFNERIKYDAFIAGNSITIGEESVIERDLFVAGSDVQILGNIGRDLRAGGSVIDIRGITINGDAYIDADSIILNEKTTITGKLTYNEDAKVTGLNEASISEVIKEKVSRVEIQYGFKERLTTFIFKIVSSTIVLLVLLYLLPKVKEKLENIDIEAKSIIKNSALGFALLILIPILFIASLFTVVLVPLSLILLVIYVISIYLSTLISSYVIGSIISKKIFNNNKMLLSIIFGLLVIYLLKLVPYIGGIVGFIALTYGIGLIFNYIKQRQM